MTPYIHYNTVTLKELKGVLKNNSIKDLMKFYNKNKYNIFFKKEDFYNACYQNNLNIIKYIYHHLQNKNFDYIEALYLSCNQKNKKLFFWLCKLNNYTRNIIYNCLFYCINYNNLYFFKFLVRKFEFNIFFNDNNLLYYSIKKKNFQFIHYILNQNPNLEIYLNDENLKYTFYLNNYFYIDKIINSTINFNLQESHINLYNNCIKLGYNDSISYLLEFNSIIYYTKNKIYQCIYNSFISNNLDTIKLFLSLNYHTDLDYNFLFNTFIIHNNIEILKFLYEIDKNIYFFNYLNIERVLKNGFLEIFIYFLKEKHDIEFNTFYYKEFEILINKYYFKIILNVNKDDLTYFYNFIIKNHININYNNLFYLVNKLIIHNQIEKLNFLKFYYPHFLNFESKNLLEDSVKSHNYDTILYVINHLNENINQHLDFILNYCYLHGVHSIIEKLDPINSFELESYDLILLKNIFRNDEKLVFRIINKTNFNKEVFSENIIDLIFKLGNNKILKLVMPFLNNYDFENIHLFNHIILNDNYATLLLIHDKIKDYTFINNHYLLSICKYGNIKFIHWFLTLNKNYENYIHSAFNTLVVYGHYEQAINFYEMNNHKEYIDLNNHHFFIFNEFVKNNNLSMVNWILNNFTHINNIQFLIYLELEDNYTELMKHDNQQILHLIIQKFKSKNYNHELLIKKIYTYAFENYKSNSLSYLIYNYDIKDYDLDLDFKTIFISCVNMRKHTIIDILIKHIPNYNWLYIFTFFDRSQLPYFNYIMKNYDDYFQINYDLFTSILYSGNLDYIISFVDYYKNKINFNLINEDDYIVLMSNNNTELFDYLYKLKSINFDNNMYIIKLLINLNKTELLKWFFSKFKFDDLHSDDDFCFHTAIVYKNLDILKLLYENDNIEIFNNNKMKYLKIASKIDSIEIFEWISNKIDDIDYTMEDNILICNSVALNNVEILKYILDKTDIDINFNDGIVITTAFGNNYNEIIKYLFKKYDNIDLTVKNEIIIKYAVEDANMEILNLLYDYNQKNNNIHYNLSKDNEYLFRIASKMNHLEVTKWLIDKKPNINYKINNHEIFYYVCEHNYYEIALYLQELNNELYKVQLNDDENEIICYHVNKILNIEGTLFITNIEKCPICLDEDCSTITDCNHQFCENCLKKINDKNHSFLCPLCRKSIEKLKYIKNIEI